jgi:hypothetical protein
MGMFIRRSHNLILIEEPFLGFRYKQFLPGRSSVVHVGRIRNFVIPRNVRLRNWESLNPPARKKSLGRRDSSSTRRANTHPHRHRGAASAITISELQLRLAVSVQVRNLSVLTVVKAAEFAIRNLSAE